MGILDARKILKCSGEDLKSLSEVKSVGKKVVFIRESIVVDLTGRTRNASGTGQT